MAQLRVGARSARPCMTREGRCEHRGWLRLGPCCSWYWQGRGRRWPSRPQVSRRRARSLPLAARRLRSRRTSRTSRRSRSTRTIRPWSWPAPTTTSTWRRATRATDNTCPFTAGRRRLRACTSRSTAAHSWTQPTYTGWSARDCLGPATPCAPHVGPIGTLPQYFENGLVSDGDPACRVRAAPRRERHVLVGERLAAVLREPDVELRRHRAPRRSRASRRSPSRAPTT